MKFELEQFNRNVPDELLLEDLKSAHAKLKSLGKNLTFRTYREVGKYASSTLHERFGSWNDALQAAGLLPRKERNVPAAALFDNLKLVWIANGRQPVYRDMGAPPSQYHGSTYLARFGGWRSALEQFVAEVADEEHCFLSSETEPPRSPSHGTRDPSLSLRFQVLKRDNFRCVACGRSPATVAGLVLEIDHIRPWSSGGRTIPSNLQTLCFDCNRGKGAT
jgi:hypothetical protein